MEIPVVFITDNNYALPTGVAITSLIRSKRPETEYKIHVIVTEDVSPENKRKLMDCGKKMAVITLIEFSAALSREYVTLGYYVTPTALLKFNIAGLLPQYDKILYLDGDILVKDDLTEFFSSDVSSVYLGAISDMAAVKLLEWHRKLNLSNYFNSGVLLMNLQKMREYNMEEMLYHIKKQNPDYMCMDQDVFNDAVRDKVLFLPLKYNVQFHNLKHPAIEGIVGVNNHHKTSYESFEDLLKETVILHLTNEFKPWKYKDALFHKEWMSMYRKSPYRSQKLDLKKVETEMALSFRIKRKTKSVIKRLPIVKQLLGRYSQLQNILWENNEILRNIQNELNKKNSIDLESQLKRLQSWDLIKSKKNISSLEEEIRGVDRK